MKKQNKKSNVKTETILGQHSFHFNPSDNGGESVTLTTKFISNGDPGGVFMNQEFTMQSYCNCASFTLCGCILTPDLLKKLANELDAALIAAKQKAS